jgi:hypothetical protein
MRYANRRRASGPAGAFTVAAVLLAALSGCSAGRWFETRTEGKSPPPPQASSPTDLKSSTVTYIRGACALPGEQRDLQLRELNESLLPNHVVVSCGRGGFPGE